MALYAIADLHLSLGKSGKPMDIFRGWTDYVQKIENNWKRIVTNDDTVVIAGDISWAMKINDCTEDFNFINRLPGNKIILKGNHDYWWTTKSKMDRYLADNGLDTISVLFNNSYQCKEYSVCGTRGWALDASGEEDIKILSREVGRLRTSIGSALKYDAEPVVFMHYPPVYGELECSEIVSVLTEYGIKKCFYGHLHGQAAKRSAVTGMYKNIDFSLISCDNTGFSPVLVR